VTPRDSSAKPVSVQGRNLVPPFLLIIVGIVVALWPTPSLCFLIFCGPNLGVMMIQYVGGGACILVGLVAFAVISTRR
jgi:hypothetical protein